MPRPRHLLAFGLGGLACAMSVGIVLAQEPAPIPSQPGPLAPVESAPGAAPGATAALGAAPPTEEAAAPPPEIGNAEAEPLPNPDDKKDESMKRPRFASAILQAVDKTTAETLRFQADVNVPVRYKGLVLTVHDCETTASDEGYADAIAHLDVQAQPESITPQPARVIFRGWMFAGSPGLHAVEHPLYDVWLIACKTAAPPAPGTKL